MSLIRRVEGLKSKDRVPERRGLSASRLKHGCPQLPASCLWDSNSRPGQQHQRSPGLPALRADLNAAQHTHKPVPKNEPPVYTLTHIHTYSLTHIHTQTYSHTHTYTHMHMCTHTHTHTYTYTYTHIITHTPAPPLLPYLFLFLVWAVVLPGILLNQSLSSEASLSGLEFQLYHNYSCDLEKVAQLLCASVSSAIKGG